MKQTLSTLLYTLLLLATISISSCKKETVTNETFSYTETIHQACANEWWLGGHTESFDNDITTTTVQQAFATQGRTYDAAKIVSAKLTSLKATAATGTSTLDDVSSIQVTIKLPGAATDIEIAHAENITAGATSVFLTINSVELKTFITQLSVLTVKITTKGGLSSGNCIDFSQGAVQVEVKP